MVNVYFFGKKYSVPGDLTIMTAMEYAGYTLKRGHHESFFYAPISPFPSIETAI